MKTPPITELNSHDVSELIGRGIIFIQTKIIKIIPAIPTISIVKADDVMSLYLSDSRTKEWTLLSV